MKNKINRILNCVLIIIMMFSQLFVSIPTFALTQEEVKSTAKKGDIYNPQTNTISTNTIINDQSYVSENNYSAGDVEVQKRIEKVNSTGKYNVSFWVRGKETTTTKTKDTYIVFVIDRSFTMGENNRWENAKQAVIDISDKLSKVEGIKMALVGFSGGKASSQIAYDDTVPLREEFSSDKFTEKEFGDYDKDRTNNGGTNIQAGLLKANELLSDKTGTKYVILLSDGVPTFYYESDGYTVGPGNSDTAIKISQVPACKDKAIEAAITLKNNGVTIYTVGYELDALTHNFTYKEVNYNEKDLAIATLKGIASSDEHYYQSDSGSSSNIANTLIAIQTEIITFPAGYNPKIEDRIGENFLLDGSTKSGGTITLNTTQDFKITEKWQKIGEFNIDIDQTLDTGWYKTNNSFSLTYKIPSGETKEIICTEDPEVFWHQDTYEYIVNYYYADINDNYSSIPDNTKTITNIKYGTIVKTKNHYLKQNEIKEGYILDDSKTIEENDKTYTINKRGIVIDIYYKRNSYNYKVNYYFDNKIDSSLTKELEANYGDVIYAQDYYLENINREALNNKNQIDNTYYFLDPNHDSNNSNIVIDIDGNVINLYYVSSKLTDEKISKMSSIDNIIQSNTKIPYTIYYSIDVSNIRKDDIISITIIDELPYEIDINNENTNLNGGIYNESDNTITWIIKETINEYKYIHKVDLEINYSVVYKNIADISSKPNNFLINTATGKTEVGSNSTSGVTDLEDISVNVQGKVIAIYVEENNEKNKLADDYIFIGLVGSNYETYEKEIDGYTLVEEKIPTNKNGKYTEEDIIVKYVYKKNAETTNYPLPPQTGVNVSNLTSYLLPGLILFLIIFSFSKIKRINNK